MPFPLELFFFSFGVARFALLFSLSPRRFKLENAKNRHRIIKACKWYGRFVFFLFLLTIFFSAFFCFLLLLQRIGVVCFEWDSEQCVSVSQADSNQFRRCDFQILILPHSLNLLCDEYCTLEALSVLDKRTRQIMNSPRELSLFLSISFSRPFFLHSSHSILPLCRSFTYNFMFT